MKFLDKIGGVFRRLHKFGVFLGALTAGFKAADEYWEQHQPTVKGIESKTEEN